MTQTVIDPPANGKGETNLTRTNPQRMIVADSSQFQNLLDTGKFEHLWRVAQLFSASQMVPEAFQNKPADCLIATQMAIRLGVDPFMFMQNTYVYKGKPGMEGKLAIALINSSGLFRGPLKFALEGEGDDRGCYAWAIEKESGERVEGPRVSIKTAKLEGWYQQNKKWQTIPDLMLQYRAGTWFGRLICPERLMGMQTVEELRDESGPVAPTPHPVHRLNASLAKTTTAPQLDDTRGQTFEQETDPAHAHPDESQAPVPQQSAAGGAPPAEASDRGSGDEGADVSGADVAPPANPIAAEGKAKRDYMAWLAEAEKAAAKVGMEPDAFDKAMGAVIVKNRVRGREWELPAKVRADVLKAIEQREGYFA